jgi:hypothetical protein
MPIKQANEKNSNKGQSSDPVTDEYVTFLNKLSADLNNPEIKDTFKIKSEWENEFFNWGISNEKQKDTKYSKEAYISFKLILAILNNARLFKIKPKQIGYAFYEDKAGKLPIIPIHSDVNIISTTDLFILPGQLPRIDVSAVGKKNIIKMLGKFDDKTKKFIAETFDGTINGKSFNLNLTTIYDLDPEKKDGIGIIDGKIGNLLNVFFRYDSFVQAYNQSYTQADILNNLLQSINDNMFGLCSLQFQKESDDNDGSPLTIIDKKLPIKNPPSSELKTIHRLKIGAEASIVKAFEFNMELSTLMQAQALYSTQLALNKAINKGEGPDIEPLAEKDDFASADLSYAPNADGYYSINSIEVNLVKEANAWNTYITTETNTTGSTVEEKEKTANEQIKELKEVLESKCVKFKKTTNAKSPAADTYIYLDTSLILKYVKTKADNSTALTYLDISLKIDGIAGISCGEYFHIDGVPEIYNRNGYFQVTNVKQSIDDKGWETTIEAGYRINTENTKQDV